MKIFYNVVLDNTNDLTLEQKRFYSCLCFVADKCLPAAFYFNSDWSTNTFLNDLNLNYETLNNKQKNLLNEFLISKGFNAVKKYDPKMPKLVYLSEEGWKSKTPKDKSLPIKIPKNEFILSTSITVNKAILEEQGISAMTSILCLAAAGIDLMLPNINFNLKSQEEIEQIKIALLEERVAYLNAITRMADESLERIKSNTHSETLRWARNEVTLKILPKARLLEEKVAKLNKNDLKKSGYSFWKNSTPAIAKAYFYGGWSNAATVTAEEVLKISVGILSDDSEKRSLPEIAYAMKIKDRIEG